MKGFTVSMANKSMKISVLDLATIVMTIKVFLSYSRAIPKSPLLDTLLTGLFVVCVVFIVIRKHYNIKTLAVIGVISLAVLYTSIQTKYSDPMITYLFILALKDKDINKQISLIYKSYSVLLIVHAVVTAIRYFTGSIALGLTTRGTYRYSLGLVHPNTLGGLTFLVVAMHLWSNYDHLKRKDYIVSAVCSIVAYLLSKSRTSFALAIICIVLVAVSKRRSHVFARITSNVAKIIFPLLTIIMFYVVRLYELGNAHAIAINKLLTGRINLGAYAFSRTGFTLLGRYIDFYGALDSFNFDYGLSNFTFDCTYTFMMCSMGVIYVIAISVFFYLLALKKNTLLNIYIILWAIYGITEVSCLNGFKFFPIFFIAVLLSNKQYGGELSNERDY